jgi:hypothetical protein
MRLPVLAGCLRSNYMPHASKTSALTRECTLLAPPSDAGCMIRLLLLLMLLLLRCLSRAGLAGQQPWRGKHGRWVQRMHVASLFARPE